MFWRFHLRLRHYRVRYWAWRERRRVRRARALLSNSPWALVIRRDQPRDGTLSDYVRRCHRASREAGWWTELKTGEPLVRNKGEMFMLMVSEIAEAMEGVRKNLMDDKLPHRSMVEVELADAVIRICDFAGGFNLDLEGAVVEKLAYNTTRPDHQIAARQASDGKKF